LQRHARHRRAFDARFEMFARRRGNRHRAKMRRRLVDMPVDGERMTFDARDALGFHQHRRLDRRSRTMRAAHVIDRQMRRERRGTRNRHCATQCRRHALLRHMAECLGQRARHRLPVDDLRACHRARRERLQSHAFDAHGPYLSRAAAQRTTLTACAPTSMPTA
jgi:hypothetical protein